MLVSGPRRHDQQELIGRAIGAVWETNHVWLIFVILLLFTCFPPAFAALSVGTVHSADIRPSRNQLARLRVRISHDGFIEKRRFLRTSVGGSPSAIERGRRPSERWRSQSRSTSPATLTALTRPQSLLVSRSRWPSAC
jgi:hypothetical protein